MVDKSRYSIAGRLMFYSAVSVIIPVLIMGVLFTFFLNSRFREYLIQENNRIREELVSNLTQYLEKNMTLDQTWMEQFSNVYMEQGMFISLNSEDGNLMWSCLLNNSEICSMHMEERNLDFIDNLQTATYEVPIGASGHFTYINISYIPPDEYSGNDLFFLMEMFKMLLLSMVISLIVSAVASVFLSKSMSCPLENLARYAVRLASNDYRAFDSFHKGTKEIDELHSAIDQLAHSLESQEKLRKRLTTDISHELRTPLTTIQSS
ncbi:MAG: hypothetical protein L3J12_09055, partial [Spirochaetales bacterium]|nr:hypothetical protein [Spirochaetales bacterium]